MKLRQVLMFGNGNHSERVISRSYYGKWGGWASIILNLFLFLVKGIIGFISGSLALIADAFHTLSDIATSVIVIISFYITDKPSDPEHPFGHGRAEFISAVIMSVLLAVTAIELLKYSIDRILHPVVFIAAWWIIGILAGTVLLKEILAFYAKHLADKIDSDTLRADSMHHHLDALSSVLVIIAFIFSKYNFPFLDGPVGVMIALIILYSAYEIARSPVNQLLGMPPNESLLTRIEEITLSFPGIKGVHDIVTHTYGQNMIISFHIEVDEDLSLIEAHQISDNVAKELREEVNAYITVHVDPVMKRTPFYEEIEDKIREFCRENPYCDSFHDLRVYQKKNKLQVILDLVASQTTSPDFHDDLIKQCKNYIKENIPQAADSTIKVEPKFSITRKSRHN